MVHPFYSHLVPASMKVDKTHPIFMAIHSPKYLRGQRWKIFPNLVKSRAHFIVLLAFLGGDKCLCCSYAVYSPAYISTQICKKKSLIVVIDIVCWPAAAVTLSICVLICLLSKLLLWFSVPGHFSAYCEQRLVRSIIFVVFWLMINIYAWWWTELWNPTQSLSAISSLYIDKVKWVALMVGN